MLKFPENVKGRSSHNFVCIRIHKFQKKQKKKQNFNAIISVTALQKYIFFEIHDHEVVNSLYIVLILKSETKVGGGVVNFRSDVKSFFSVY
jgi:hypothetical protein